MVEVDFCMLLPAVLHVRQVIAFVSFTLYHRQTVTHQYATVAMIFIDYGYQPHAGIFASEEDCSSCSVERTLGWSGCTVVSSSTMTALAASHQFGDSTYGTVVKLITGK